MTRRIEVPNEWAMHTLDHWHSVAGNPFAPGSVRVAAVAYASVTGNGHVPINSEDLARSLPVRLDRATGVVDLPSLASVKRWRNDAVRLGLLDAATWGRCLVLPHGVTTNLNVKGSPHRECLVCKNRTPAQGGGVQNVHP